MEDRSGSKAINILSEDLRKSPSFGLKWHSDAHIHPHKTKIKKYRKTAAINDKHNLKIKV